MGFIKAEPQPAYAMGMAHGQPSVNQPNHFAYLPFGPPSMDGLHNQELCKSSGADGRSKVARGMSSPQSLPICTLTLTPAPFF